MILRHWCAVGILLCLTANHGHAQTFPAQYDSTRICQDAPGFAAKCAQQKAIGLCKHPSVYRQCLLTCRTCAYESWSNWGPWSKCSKSCGPGTNTRRRVCPGIICGTESTEEVKGCEISDCRALSPRISTDVRGRTSVQRYLYDLSSFQSEEKVCLDTEFRCPDSDKCIEFTKKCDGVKDCSSGKDEIDCPLGLRNDGVFGIINWKHHKCLEVVSSAGVFMPILRRRCPGPYNDQKTKFMWKWYDHSTLQHVDSGLCLTVNLTYVNGSDVPKVKLLLVVCDRYDSKQHWRCSGYRIELYNPQWAVPNWNYNNIYVRINESAQLDQENLILSHGSDDSSYFYMLGTNKRLSICAKIYGTGTGMTWSWWSLCDKTCGGGTQKKKKDWAIQGNLECDDCEEYEIRKCNTQPCPVTCPPGFRVHVSPHNRNDKNCFKVFEESKTYADAQRFCEESNWTLAAIKDSDTNKLITELMQAEGPNQYYIGVHEKFHGVSLEAPDNSVTYLLDDQPVGVFQPWFKKMSDSDDIRGCTIGYGFGYDGSLNVTALGNECLNVNGREDYCRNYDGVMNTPWCYIRRGRELVKEACHIPNCMEFNEEDPKIVNHEYNFNIRSMDGDDGQCIAVLSSDKVVTAPCNCNDKRQNFQWLHGTYLMNSLFGKCLSPQTYPPVHGGEITVKECPNANSPLKQGWHAKQLFLSLIWDGLSDYQTLTSLAYGLEHDRVQKKIKISDVRREHFLAWNLNIGLTGLGKLISSSAFGSQVLLKGEACGMCIKSSDSSRRLELSPCAAEDFHQRWMKYGESAFMNTATGLCLSAFGMRFYVTLNDCDSSDGDTHWGWNEMSENLGSIQHDTTGFFLTCGCTGYTPVCLTPDKTEAGNWEMVVNENAPSLKGQHGKLSDNVGEAFTFRSASNSTKCAYPSKAKSQTDASFHVSMTTCDLHNMGQLWWFAEDGSWIKHRGLNKCMHGCTDNACVVTLQECSQSERNMQSWTIIPESSVEDTENVMEDRVCLKSNHSLCLSSQLYDDITAADYVLTVKHFRQSRHWIAELVRGVFIPLEMTNDCVPPWTMMHKYRGVTSWTEDGMKCQRWDSQWPHRHPFTPDTFPNDGLEKNYCRQPPGIPTHLLRSGSINEAWCLTLYSTVPWQKCSVTRCVVAGVMVNSVTGMWKSSGGGEKRPFVCQAPAECYANNGVSFSGYYAHTGRVECMNWREYHDGNKEWPDHARCMNWNNDTLKPWCWVARGVAQYCDVIDTCPVACKDPRLLMRNMLLFNVSYVSSSKNYMPGSYVTVICQRGYQADVKYQKWTCNENGEWTPRSNPCTRVVCPEPANYENTIMVTPRNFFYGSKVVYHCKDGSMIEPGRNVIEITCLQDGSWSQLPYRCVAACKSGWTNFNRSCYKVGHDEDHYVTYQSAKQKCSGQGSGSLATPRTKQEYAYLASRVVNRGLTGKPYWLGVRNAYDVDADITKIFHRWIGDSAKAQLPETELYLDKLDNFTFFITSFTYQSSDKKSFLDQCIFGDGANRRVLIKSCVYAEVVNLKWMWTRNDHLYHLGSGLCLTSDGSKFYLDDCLIEENLQMFVCGPDNGYLLRLKHRRFGYVVLEQTDAAGDLKMGDASSPEELAMWLTYPDRKYLCHWNIKPPDKVFLVHTGEFPTFVSFHVYDKDPCRHDITGSYLAKTTELTAYMSEEPLDWCACPFALDVTNKRVNVIANSLGGCNVRHVVTPSAAQLKDCTDLNFADSFCITPENPDPDFLSEKCAAMHLRRSLEVEFLTRQCNVPLPGYICQEPAVWSCLDPPIPRNGKSVSESLDLDDMKFAYGSTITISCKEGYWVESQHRYDLKLYCNENLQWELTLQHMLRDENEEKYIHDEKSSSTDIYGGVGCDKIICRQPPMLFGLDLLNQTGEDGAEFRKLVNYIPINWTGHQICDQTYYFGDSVIFRCAVGTWFNSSKTDHAMSCMLDGTWQPTLGQDERCTVVSCTNPPDIPFSNQSISGLLYASSVVYTCFDGFWISKEVWTVTSNCSAFGRWVPNHEENNVTCVPSSCENPSPSLFSSSVIQVGKVTTYLNGIALTLQCKPGFWFDKDTHQVTFTCDKTGRWMPYHPHESRCKRIFCQQPEDVAGATRYGSDYASGSHVRYYCSRRFWIRRQFQIYNPQWDLCLHTKNTINSNPVSAHRDIAIDSNCGPTATPSHWWQWQWTYHIKNLDSELCLTATALPVLEEDSVGSRLETCEKENVMQMWSCESVTNGWGLRLWSAYTGGYFVASSKAKNFWVDIENLQLLVTGSLDYETSVVVWNTYHYKDEDMSVCIMKEGNFYESVHCDNYGSWQPDPFSIACTLVKCGLPPAVPNAQISSNHSVDLSAYDELDARIRWRQLFLAAHDFEVGTEIVYICNTGFWVSPSLYHYSLTCLDNSNWSPDPEEEKCVPAYCSIPLLRPWMKVRLWKNSPTSTVLDFTSVFPDHGWKEFQYPLDMTEAAKYRDVATLMCEDGYWLSSGSSVGKKDIERSAQCSEDGRWNQTLIVEDTTCELLTCPNPGQMANAHRVVFSEEERDATGNFFYRSQIQYKCHKGFWISIAQRHVQISCSRRAVWVPDPSAISCSPISCGDPGSIANGLKIGNSYSLHDEVIYKCNEGFRFGNLFTRRSVQCTDDGSWFPPSYSLVCDPVLCADPPEFDNSNLRNISQRIKGRHVYGDRVTMRCHHGYVFEDTVEGNFLCNSKGQWEAASPADEFYRCRPAICDKPVFSSEFTVYDKDEPHLVNDTIYYSCPTVKNNLHTVDFISCVFDAEKNPRTEWEPDPDSLSCKEASECPKIDPLPKATLDVSGYMPGNVAYHTCFLGYKFSTSTARMTMSCNKYGRWRPTPPKLGCVQQQCDQPVLDDSLVIEKFVDSPGIFHPGDRLEISCPSGYWIRDKNSHARGQLAMIADCSINEKWTANLEKLTCAKVFCDDPGTLSNGIIQLIQGNVLDSGYSMSTKIQVTCNEGYVNFRNGKKSTQYQCSNEGIWQPLDSTESEFRCVFLSCSDPGTRSYATRYSTTFEYGQIVIYEAYPGYWSPKADSPMVTLMCSGDGTWVYVHPSTSNRAKRSAEVSVSEVLDFVPIECNNPKSPPVNSHFLGVVNSSLTGTELTVICNDSYVISPGVDRTESSCTLYGWFPPTDSIVCVPETSMFCTIPVIANLIVSGASTHAGVVLSLTCDVGYALGNGMTTTQTECMENGEWDPPWNTVNCTKYSCEEPPAIDHAVVVTDSEYTTATIECDKGYSFEDDVNRKTLKIICAVGIDWDPLPLNYKCIPIDCGIPSFITSPSFRYSPIIQFSCKTGYSVYLNGVSHSTVSLSCTDDRTWSVVGNPTYTDKSMICRVTTCSEAPPVKANAHYFMYHGNHYNSTVMYHCFLGYITPSGGKTFEYICSKDGSWVPLDISATNAFCERVSCPVVQSVLREALAEYETRGVFQPSPITNLYGDRLRYICFLTGEPSQIYTCNWNQQWDPYLKQPCEKIRCKTPPDIENAVGSGDNIVGTVYNYQCTSGYEFSQSVTVMRFQCTKDGNDNGVWIPPFPYTMKCRLPQCVTPNLPYNTVALDKIGNRYIHEANNWGELDLSVGSSLTIKCSTGYESNTTDVKSVCQNTRTWNPATVSILSCSPVLCSAPVQIPGAMLSNSNPPGKLKYLDSVQYSCLTSYFFESERSRDVTVVCMESGLLVPDPSDLECVPTTCIEQQDVKNALIIHLTGLFMGSKATYRCDTGYRFPSGYEYEDFSCNAHGSWEPDMSENYCKRLICNAPNIAQITFGKEVAEFGEIVELTCRSGFFLVDYRNVAVRYVECGSSGVFLPDPMRLSCMRVQCRSLSAPANATISSYDYYGGNALLKCFDGHLTVDRKTYVTAVCQEDGSWSQDLDQDTYACKPAECEDEPVVRNAVSAIQSKSFQGKMQISCDRGYRFAGKSKASANELTVTCSSNLTWETPENLTCIRTKCPSLPTLNSASLYGDTPYSGNSYTYVCNPMAWIAEMNDGKLELTGQKEFQVTCGDDGKWYPPVNFQCTSLLDAESTAVGRATVSVAPPESDPYVKSERAWIQFQPALMSISDSGFSKSTTSSSLSYNIENIWDSNPLTYWISSKDYSVENAWGIDFFFGKPITVTAFMIMGLDDYKSNIANFTMVFANSKNVVERIGPYQVYGGLDSSERLVRDFPLKFSSVANCFVYDNLKSEMLWLHLMVHPLHKGKSLAIREVGFFASDADSVIEETGQDSTPLVYWFGLLLLAVIVTPMLYFVEEKFMAMRMIYGCCGRKRPCNIVRFVTESTGVEKCHLLIQLIGCKGDGPIGLVSQFGAAKVGGKINNEIHIPGEVDDIGEIEKIRIMWFRSDEYKVYDRDVLPLAVVLNKLTVGNSKRRDFQMQAVDNSITVTSKQPLEIDLEDVSSVMMPFVWGSAAILRSYLPVSVILPPNFNLLSRAERFLCLVLMCVGGSALTLLFAGFFTTLFGNRVERIFTVDTLCGFLGAAICLPLPSLLRTLSSLFAKRYQGKTLSTRMDDEMPTSHVQRVVKIFLGLIEIAEASTSMPLVDFCKQFDVVAPNWFAGMRKSASCSSMREALDLMSVPAKTSVASEGLPIRLSSSCHSLNRNPNLQVETTRSKIHSSEHRSTRGLFPSGVPPASGKKLVRRFYTDVLNLSLTPVHPRKSTFHILSLPVMIFFIAASISLIVAQYLQLGEHAVDVESLILHSVMFTILVSFTTDVLFAWILFRENI